MYLNFPSPGGATNATNQSADSSATKNGLEENSAFAILFAAALDSSSEQCTDILASGSDSEADAGDLLTGATLNVPEQMKFTSAMERILSPATPASAYYPLSPSASGAGNFAVPATSGNDTPFIRFATVQTKIQNFDSSPTSSGAINKDELSKWMDAHALTRSSHHCAMYCRMGMEAAGLNTADRPATGDAGDYGPFLLRHGAQIVPKESYSPRVGDVVIFSKTSEHPSGHIEMYDGQRWVSDFKQQSLSPYRDVTSAPPYTIYRLS
jgi:hypothetical protein